MRMELMPFLTRRYHVDVGETPFLVAVDFEWRTVVVSIRGTLSLKVSVGSTVMIG